MKKALCVFFALLLTACAATAAPQPTATLTEPPVATSTPMPPIVTPAPTAMATVAPTETPAPTATAEVISAERWSAVAKDAQALLGVVLDRNQYSPRPDEDGNIGFYDNNGKELFLIAQDGVVHYDLRFAQENLVKAGDLVSTPYAMMKPGDNGYESKNEPGNGAWKYVVGVGMKWYKEYNLDHVKKPLPSLKSFRAAPITLDPDNRAYGQVFRGVPGFGSILIAERTNRIEGIF